MKALVLEEKGQLPVIRALEDPQPKGGEVVVDLKAAGLNRREVWMVQGLYPGLQLPVVPGSDGCGLLDGREVLINPSLAWGDNPAYPGKEYRILGMPENGTFAEKIAISKDYVYDKPAHLSTTEAAVLPLGGLTAYRALFTKGQLKAGEKVLISGVGGGVAMLAFQFAKAAGAEVYVTSGSDDKIEKAKTLGAQGGANYKKEDWSKTLKSQAGSFDVIIDSAGGPGFSELVGLCNYGARISVYGGTLGKVAFQPQRIFWRQISILGTSMGSDEDFDLMLRFVDAHKVVPIVDQVFSLEDGAEAYRLMEKGLQFGKIAISIA